MDPKPVKRIWSTIVSSFGEAQAAIHSGIIDFPLIAVPWGAETTGARVQFFTDIAQLDESFGELHAEAWPHEGLRKIHLIHTKGVHLAAFWL
jgi:hypothetical protein